MSNVGDRESDVRVTDSAANIRGWPGPAGIAGGIALVGAVTLAAAWAFEIIGGYIPCPLCLEQRNPYYIAVPLAAALAFLAAWRPRQVPVRAGLAVVGAVFVWGLYLAGYHAGAEWGWWQGPTDCAVDAGSVRDAGMLLGQLQDFEFVRCDEAPWRFLGLSFAGWNFVIQAGLAGAAFAGAAKKQQPQKQ